MIPIENKEYELLKDLPNAKKGAIYKLTEDGKDYVCLNAMNTWDVCYPKEYVENNPEWFREKTWYVVSEFKGEAHTIMRIKDKVRFTVGDFVEYCSYVGDFENWCGVGTIEKFKITDGELVVKIQDFLQPNDPLRGKATKYIENIRHHRVNFLEQQLHKIKSVDFNDRQILLNLIEFTRNSAPGYGTTLILDNFLNHKLK